MNHVINGIRFNFRKGTNYCKMLFKLVIRKLYLLKTDYYNTDKTG